MDPNDDPMHYNEDPNGYDPEGYQDQNDPEGGYNNEGFGDPTLGVGDPDPDNEDVGYLPADHVSQFNCITTLYSL